MTTPTANRAVSALEDRAEQRLKAAMQQALEALDNSAAYEGFPSVRRAAAALRAALAEQQGEAASDTTFCWLVEEFGPDGNSTGRYMLDMGSLAITHDVYAARRLRREQSAGFRALDMKERHGGDWRPVEHGFSAAPQPPAQQSADPVAPLQVFGVIDPDYARVFTVARVIAWSYGYACLAHGSFTRDLDLLLVPWTETAQADDIDYFAPRIADAAGLAVSPNPPTIRPHGRKTWTLLFPGFADPRWVDLSVLAAPPQRQPLTDERIDAIADLVVKGMPDGIQGFMKEWGWRQFARALLEVCDGHCRQVATEPDPALLESMALRYRHDFGLVRNTDSPIGGGVTPEEREAILRQMRQLWEEVVGLGFYRPGGSKP